MADLTLLPSAIIEQLRAWFFAKDRSVILADDTFLGLKEQSTPSYPQQNNLYIYPKSDKILYKLDDNGVETPLSASGFNNYFVNSQFLIDQEGNASGTTGNTVYIVDQWLTSFFNVAAGTHTYTRSTTIPPNGVSPYSLSVASSGATYDANIGLATFQNFIESQYIYMVVQSDFFFSFWAMSDTTGRYSASLRDSTISASYVVALDLIAGEWKKFSVEIPAPMIGTWPVDNTRGMRVDFCLAVGTTYSTAPDIWTSGNFIGATGMTNPSDATLYIAEPMLSPVSPIYQPNLYNVDLDWCKRYFELLGGTAVYELFGAGYCAATTAASIQLPYREKRIVPSLAFAAAGNYMVRGNGGSIVAATVMGSANQGIHSSEVNVTTASGLTVQSGTVLHSNNTLSGTIAVNARM